MRDMTFVSQRVKRKEENKDLKEQIQQLEQTILGLHQQIELLIEITQGGSE